MVGNREVGVGCVRTIYLERVFLHVCEGLLGGSFSYPVQMSLPGALEDVLN